MMIMPGIIILYLNGRTSRPSSASPRRPPPDAISRRPAVHARGRAFPLSRSTRGDAGERRQCATRPRAWSATPGRRDERVGADAAAASVTGTGRARPRRAGHAARPVHPYVHVVIVAVIGAVAVLAWLIVFEAVNKLLWENDFVTANPWLFPVICLPFSLARRPARQVPPRPDDTSTSRCSTASRGDVSKIDWRTLPVNVVMAWASLFSGAVLGPEGGIGGIASKIAAFYGEKVGIPVEHRSRLVFSTLASAYNGLIANPLFTGRPRHRARQGPGGEEPQPAGQPHRRRDRLPHLLRGGQHRPPGLPAPLADRSRTQPIDVLLVVVFGLIGLVLAVIAGALFRVAAALFGRFEGREVERALVAGRDLQRRRRLRPDPALLGRDADPDGGRRPGGYGPAVLSGWRW